MNNGKKIHLSEIAEYGSNRVQVKQLDLGHYISTENMLPNRGGVVPATTLPAVEIVNSFSPGNVLVSNIRPYFKKIWYADCNGGVSNDVLCFVAKKQCLPKYLYYLLSSDSFFEYVMSAAKGTKMPRGDKKHIMDYRVSLPDQAIQEKAISILSSLDKKIEVNNKINRNLEEQAKAIFKSWFVDFEPFGGIRPAKMIDVPLEQICTTITKGTTPTTIGRSFLDNGINFIKAESITDYHTFDLGKFSFIDDDTHSLLRRSQIQKDDILFTIAGTLGRYAYVDESLLPANTNQAVAIIRADKGKISPLYVYSFFVGGWHQEFYKKRIQQAVQANLSLGTIKSLPIPILPTDLMDGYIRKISVLFDFIRQNNRESQTLVQLRDTLLPKLMSGEIPYSEETIV